MKAIISHGFTNLSRLVELETAAFYQFEVKMKINDKH
jgi:hypothetical protein